MVMHLIPADDVRRHARSANCVCVPIHVEFQREDGTSRPAVWHHPVDEVTPAAVGPR